MWQVENHTPFAHHSAFLRDHEARSFWSVWLKASFTFRPGQPLLYRAQQEPVRLAPEFADGAPPSDLLADSDVCPPKPEVDVVLKASAYAPPGTKGRYDATLRVADAVTKTLSIIPPGTWGHRNELIARPDGQEAGAVPLIYAMSWGGADWPANPLGQGYRKTGAEGSPLPRVMPAGKTPRKPDEAPTAISFACIPKTWPQRLRLGGTYDDEWRRRRAPLLPADLDPAYWQSVPEDQRLSRQKCDGARIELLNMTSADGEWSEGSVAFDLPKLDFEVVTRFKGQWEPGRFDLQTIEIDAEARRLSLCWQMAFETGASQNDVRVERTFIALRGQSGFRVSADDAALFASGSAAEGNSMAERMA
jgi:hypothetical protein